MQNSDSEGFFSTTTQFVNLTIEWIYINIDLAMNTQQNEIQHNCEGLLRY